ncbi:DUF4333 domain-containing protein, partial [Rhodococcus oryzae]|uniref:DUF4333 domain-containing protein n=1 Tax=Rhodococcus oryzae TaxID=2571143 RepID=UPI0037AE7452
PGQPQTGAQPQFQAYNAPQQQQQYPGQPGQYQQGGYQPGQPGQPQWGAPVAGQPGAGSSKAPLWIALGVGAVVVLGAIAVIAGMAFVGGDTLDRAAAERGVEQVLTGSYGIKDVDNVTCPADQKVEKDESFTCELTVDGEPQQVTVTFTDDSGTYEVSRPTSK